MVQAEDISAALAPAFAGRVPARLSAEQRLQFERNGCLVLEDVLSPAEVAHYRAVVRRLDHGITRHVQGRQERQRQPGDPLELRNAVAVAPELLDLMVHPQAFPLVLELMGPHVALTTSHVFIRPTSPKDAKASYKAIDWHRDGPSPAPPSGTDRPPWLYTKIGYFLTDLTIPDAGALRVVPGSHRYAGPAASAPGAFDPYGAIEVKVKPGSAVIFENRVLHAVGPNFSTVARENVYFGYCWRYLRAIDFISQPAELLAQATPIQRQLLGQAATSLGYYLPSPEDTPLQPWLAALQGAAANAAKGPAGQI